MKKGMKRILVLILSVTMFFSMSSVAWAGSMNPGGGNTDTERPDGDPPDGDPPDGTGGGGSGGSMSGTSGFVSGEAVTDLQDGDEYSDCTFPDSTGAGEVAVRALDTVQDNPDDGVHATLSNVVITKTGGNYTEDQDSTSFYGINSGFLVAGKDAEAYVTLDKSKVETSAFGANGVFSYGNGRIDISESTVTTTGSSSGGIMVAGGGTLYAFNNKVTTEGGSSAAIRSDRGSGVMVIDQGEYISNGSSGIGSPAIYCVADITVANATLAGYNAQAICFEGRNPAWIYNCWLEGDYQASDDDENSNVMIYQSMSGDSSEGTSSFTMVGGVLKADNESTSGNAKMFYTTNTYCYINLYDVEMIYSDTMDTFLLCACNTNTRGWGTEGANGSECILYCVDQDIEKNIVYDTWSYLDCYFTQGSNAETAILCRENNGDRGASVYMDSSSTWTLTGDSVVKNLYTGGATIKDVNGKTARIVSGSLDSDANASEGSTVYVAGDTGAYTIIVTGTYSTADNSSYDSVATVGTEKPDFIYDFDELGIDTSVYTPVPESEYNYTENRSVSIKALENVFPQYVGDGSDTGSDTGDTGDTGSQGGDTGSGDTGSGDTGSGDTGSGDTGSQGGTTSGEHNYIFNWTWNGTTSATVEVTCEDCDYDETFSGSAVTVSAGTIDGEAVHKATVYLDEIPYTNVVYDGVSPTYIEEQFGQFGAANGSGDNYDNRFYPALLVRSNSIETGNSFTNQITYKGTDGFDADSATGIIIHDNTSGDNGIMLKTSDYTISDARIILHTDADGTNTSDFSGRGTAIAIYGSESSNGMGGGPGGDTGTGGPGSDTGTGGGSGGSGGSTGGSGGSTSVENALASYSQGPNSVALFVEDESGNYVNSAASGTITAEFGTGDSSSTVTGTFTIASGYTFSSVTCSSSGTVTVEENNGTYSFSWTGSVRPDNLVSFIINVTTANGLAILAYSPEDDGGVYIEDSYIETWGVATMPVVADATGMVTIRNTTMISHGGVMDEGVGNTSEQGDMVSPPWILGIMGDARCTNLMGSDTIMNVLDSETAAGNWAVLSTDSGSDMVLNVYNSSLTLLNTGLVNFGGSVGYSDNPYTDRYGAGYGTYAIGYAEEVFAGADINVGTYATIFTGGQGTYTSLKAGYEYTLDGGVKYTSPLSYDKITTINSDTFGFMAHQDDNSLTINNGTKVNSRYATFLIKVGANETMVANIDNAVINNGGVLIQVMDNDDSTSEGPGSDGNFASTYYENSGFKTDGNTTTEADSQTFTFTNGNYIGNIYNGSNSSHTTKTVNGSPLTVNLGEGATLKGAAASTAEIHVTYEGSLEVKTGDAGYAKGNGLAFDDAEEAAAFAAEYQNTEFTISEYYSIGQVANLVSYNNCRKVNMALTDDAWWYVTGTSDITSLDIEDDAHVIVPNDVTLKVESGSRAGEYSGVILAASSRNDENYDEPLDQGWNDQDPDQGTETEPGPEEPGTETHSWVLTRWDWSDDYSSATAVFTCIDCGDIESVTTTDIASAEDSDGNITYTATVIGPDGMSYTDRQTVEGQSSPGEEPGTVVHDWDYDNIVWTWADDYSSATAAISCKDGDGAEQVITTDEIYSFTTIEGDTAYIAVITAEDGNEYYGYVVAEAQGGTGEQPGSDDGLVLSDSSHTPFTVEIYVKDEAGNGYSEAIKDLTYDFDSTGDAPNTTETISGTFSMASGWAYVDIESTGGSIGCTEGADGVRSYSETYTGAPGTITITIYVEWVGGGTEPGPAEGEAFEVEIDVNHDQIEFDEDRDDYYDELVYGEDIEIEVVIPEGLEDVATVSYQWYRYIAGLETYIAIEDATEDTYTLVGEDINAGDHIYLCRVTAVYDDGSVAVVDSWVEIQIDPAEQEIAYAETTVKKTVGDDSFTNPLAELSRIYGDITYSSSNIAVATVDRATGEVTIVGAGEAVITATAAGSSNYTEAIASYTITVAEAEGEPGPEPTPEPEPEPEPTPEPEPEPGGHEHVYDFDDIIWVWEDDYSGVTAYVFCEDGDGAYLEFDCEIEEVPGEDGAYTLIGYFSYDGVDYSNAVTFDAEGNPEPTEPEPTEPEPTEPEPTEPDDGNPTGDTGNTGGTGDTGSGSGSDTGSTDSGSASGSTTSVSTADNAAPYLYLVLVLFAGAAVAMVVLRRRTAGK